MPPHKSVSTLAQEQYTKYTQTLTKKQLKHEQKVIYNQLDEEPVETKPADSDLNIFSGPNVDTLDKILQRLNCPVFRINEQINKDPDIPSE